MKGLIATVLLVTACPVFAGPADVRTMRVPDNGIQPQVVARGDVIHLIYFTGDPKAGDVRYARSSDGGRTFAKAIRVNSQPGSAIAIGTIRGPRLAVGKAGRAHVAWMGSHDATPKSPGSGAPMLYARINDAGDAFEPQRNVIAAHAGLDGGGTVAADERGNVYIVWHAPQDAKDHDEQGRAVWAARSTDDGKTFAPETRVSAAGTGVCACCGLDALADAEGDAIHVLYRTASQRVHRDMTLLRYDFAAARREATTVGRLEVGICVMSTSSFASPPGRLVAAWEGRGEVFYAPVGADRLESPAMQPPAAGKNAKHPRLAVNAAGQTLVVWTEGTAWNKGGSVAWQLLDERLQPIAGAAGRAEGLPTWGTAAVFAAPGGGGFIVIY